MLQGGNPQLNPERANTYTVGAVLTPRAIPGLYASIDYFHIDLKGVIGTIPLGVSMNDCLARACSGRSAGASSRSGATSSA